MNAKTAGTLDRYRRHLGVGRARLAKLMSLPEEYTAQGSHVWTTDGRKLLDCGGYGVFILGHCHPAVVHAVQRQLFRNPLATRLLVEPCLARASETLAGVVPQGLERVMFANSGAEAVEVALKLARANGRRSLVTMRGGYHGKTLGALSATPTRAYQEAFAPLFGATVVRYGDAAALDSALAALPRSAVIVEPVQGEGGVNIPPPGYLARVREVCDAHGAMMIVDEIQTGLGRLGAWWGVSEEGVAPDILLTGKGLSGGVVPVAAAVAQPEAFEPFDQDPMLHSSTFAGSPLAMAAVEAALTAIQGEDVPERARTLGETLLPQVRDILLSHCPRLVRQVRGRGLLLGIEFKDPRDVGLMTLELLDQGVISNHSLNDHNVLRLTPPSTLSRHDREWLLTATEIAACNLGRLADESAMKIPA